MDRVKIHTIQLIYMFFFRKTINFRVRTVTSNIYTLEPYHKSIVRASNPPQQTLESKWKGYGSFYYKFVNNHLFYFYFNFLCRTSNICDILVFTFNCILEINMNIQLENILNWTLILYCIKIYKLQILLMFIKFYF